MDEEVRPGPGADGIASGWRGLCSERGVRAVPFGGRTAVVPRQPAPKPSAVTYGDAMDPSAVWRDRQHQWRIEAYRAPDLRFAIYATNGPTESVPLWLFGMTALARWLMTHSISLDDLEVD